MSDSVKHQTLSGPNGNNLAYVHYKGTREDLPTIVFLTGFRSDMAGSKVLFLEDACKKRGQSFVRFDYSGHGSSDGNFTDGTIGGWTDDALAIIDNVTDGPVVPVGSSMGGWIMLLIAEKRPDRIKGLIGIAAAPDFTREMNERHFDEAIWQSMDKAGHVEIPNDYSDEPYIITKALIDDGEKHCLLDRDIQFDGPVSLLQGMQDADVPWQKAIQIKNALTSHQADVILIETATHRMSRDEDLKILGGEMERISTLSMGKHAETPNLQQSYIKLG